MNGIRTAAILVGAGLFGAFAATVGGGDSTRLTFLAVGQGDCAVFQSGGHTILIDVGPKSRYTDAGKRIVVPNLRRLGVDAIDLILLSHPDTDHTGGLAAVLNSIPVGQVAIPAGFQEDGTMLAELKAAGCPMSKVLWLQSEQTARLGSFEIDVDCPIWHEGDPDNDGSDFIKITNGAASAVFTGDASSRTEEKMLPIADWSAQVMKLGHHGSHTATGEAWLAEVHPKWAVVSCGKTNPYGHPHRDVLDRLEQHGIEVARTDTEGNVTFVAGPDGWARLR